MVDYVHRFLLVFASLILSGQLVGCAGVSPKVDAGSTVSVMFPAPPPDAALAPAPVAVPAPAAPGVEGPPSTDAVLVNGKPVSGTEIIGEWKRMDGPRSCWLAKQADGASQIKCYPSVHRSRVGRSNFSANRRATTASLGDRAFSVKTVCFGSIADIRCFFFSITCARERLRSASPTLPRTWCARRFVRISYSPSTTG